MKIHWGKKLTTFLDGQCGQNFSFLIGDNAKKIKEFTAAGRQ